MKKATFFASIWILALTFFLGLQSLKASHAMAADLSLTCISGNEYRVRVSFYRDCAGIFPPSSYTIDVRSASCGQNLSVPVTLLPGYPIEVSPVCNSQIGNTSCNSGVLTGIQAWIYEGTITLPMACSDWTFSFREYARNAAITTLVNPGTQYLYIETIIDNTQAPCNNTPYFTSRPVPFFCLGEPFIYNHGAVDPDGDSLSYRLIDALDNAGNSVIYNVGYNGSNPLSSSPVITIDPYNGNIFVQPSAFEIAVIAVLVEEYRNGVLIGSTIRDIQVTVINCINTPPTTTPPINVVNGALLNPYTIEACPGLPLSFEVVGTDSNALDSVLLSWNQIIPGATFTVTGSNPATGTFQWTPSGNDAGSHTMVIFSNDNGCPILLRQSQAIEIIVPDGTTGGPDQGYCTAGNPPVLQASGGSNFLWTVLSGDSSSLSCTNCPSPTATPTVTSTYAVSGNLLAGCRYSDTVTVTVAPNFNLTLSADTMICEGGSISLLASPDLADSYSYSWTPAASLNNAQVSNPVASPPTHTTYYAEVTSSLGCIQRDSVTVSLGPDLVVDALASANSACQGETLNLNALLNASPAVCGPTTNTCASPSTMMVGASTNVAYRPSPFYGYYEDGRVQYLFHASELQAQGFTGGILQGIAFDVFAPRSWRPYNGLTVRVGCTAMSNLLAFQNGLTPVYSGTHSTSVGWNTFNFTTPYEWDGVSNLIVEVCFDNSNWSREDPVVCSLTPFTSVVYDYADNASGCSLPNTRTSNARADTRFIYCNSGLPSSLSYSWTPTTGLSSASIPNPSVNLSSSTTYSVLVTDLLSGCVTQDQVLVEVATANAGPPQAICMGDTTQVSATYIGPDYSVPPANCGLNPAGCTGSTQMITLGNDSIISGNTPFEGSNDGARFQMLCTASEINGLGLPGGTITSIGLDISQKNSTQPYNNFTIRMACTNQFEVTGFSGGLDQVFVGNVTTTTGWNNFTLDTPYDWDGVSNLIIEFCFWNNSNTADDLIRCTSTSFNSMAFAQDNLIPGCNLFAQVIGTQRPNVQLEFCQNGAPTYTWSPASVVSDPNMVNPLAFPTSSQYLYVDIDNGDCVVRDSVFVTVDCFLPVELGDFEGARKGDRNHLWWFTSSEINSDFFAIEREQNGRFTQIGTVAAAGNSLTRIPYEFYDESPLNGPNRYRLRIQDLDGQWEHSNIVEILSVTEAPLQVLRVWPNPSQDRFTFDLHFTQSQSAELLIYDAAGKILQQRPLQGQGDLQEEIDLSPYPGGLYFYEIRSRGSESLRGKLLLL